MSASEVEIIDVWADNLEEAMNALRALVDDYPYVAMDTEFPGVVARPVDLLRLIQLGVCFSDKNGYPPPGPSTFQFHFKFDLNDEMYAQESIDLLLRAGIDFKKHCDYGIDAETFGEVLISSGLVLNPNIRWIAFHSGYDLGYLVKLLTCLPLPAEQHTFFDVVSYFFPRVYDLKYMMKSCRNLKGGLQDLADDLECPRIGPQHQAGSDSLLTLHTFFKMKKLFFEDYIDDEKFSGVLFGLGMSWGGGNTASYNGFLTTSQTLNPMHAGGGQVYQTGGMLR